MGNVADLVESLEHQAERQRECIENLRCQIVEQAAEIRRLRAETAIKAHSPARIGKASYVIDGKLYYMVFLDNLMEVYRSTNKKRRNAFADGLAMGLPR